LSFLKNGINEGSELLWGIMLKGIEHGEEHEDAFKQCGQGDGTGSLHLASGQAHEEVLGLPGHLASLAGEVPDKKAGVGRFSAIA
jgi:hypothetical protein